MAESHVISGLVSKRSELAGQIDYYQNQIKQIQVDVSAIDTAIKVFNPDYDMRSIKSKQHRIKNHFFKHGEGNRTVLDAIREAGTPVSTINIVERVIVLKKLDLDAAQRDSFKACVFVVLKRLQNNGVIKEMGRENLAILWGIKQNSCKP